MSPVGEVLARIDDIRSQMDQLRGGGAASLLGTAAAAATSASTASSAASASAFADALSTAGGTAPLATTGSVDAVKGSIASGSGATGDDVVSGARKYLGVPYVFGGEDASGMDCSGLVQTVFGELGVSMPRVVPDQARMGVEVPSLAEAKPGDLLVAKGEGHIVIYIGDGKVLHAPRPGKDVQIVDNWYKDADLSTIRRIVPATGTEAAAPSLAGLAGLSGLSGLSGASGLSGLSALAGTTGTSATGGASTDLMTAALQRMMSGGSLS